MSKALKALCVFGILGFGVMIPASPPAFAITAELANTCRAMALKAYPRKLAGSKKGTSEAERNYFRDCVARGGTAPDDKNQQTPAQGPAAK